jgi:flagellar basal-body rod protein FlgB
MFIDRLLNDGNSPIIEASVRFAAARHRLLAENIANVDTPNYVQKDLSVAKFHQLLSDKVQERDHGAPGSVSFDDLGQKIENPTAGILFHDRNNRSMERLMSDAAKNALFHNMMTELLRRQFASIETALKERVG